jgi:hypothetical protein
MRLQVLDPGEVIGTLVAALLGAMSITGEIRQGTIRPTLLVSPGRGGVITAKVWASMLAGAAFGLPAGTLAIATSTLALRNGASASNSALGTRRCRCLAALRRAPCGPPSVSVSALSCATRSPPSSACRPGCCSWRIRCSAI